MTNPIFKLIKAGMDAGIVQHSLISNNIANAETAHYVGSKLDFDSYLKDAVARRSMALARTDQRHLPARQVTDITPYIRLGGPVSIDAEMADLARNTLTYHTFTEFMIREQDMLKTAIKGGK
jgi:flagellar basal-body rod protein FlgB